ncbi:hypothetical protein JYP51_09470 [Ponticoccus gilvus]|nr:hypothetical protein [Enemella evansiae]
MATPAQVANDMAAHAAYWEKRDRRIERLCRDAARVIRLYLSGERVDRRTWAGLHMRLLSCARDESSVKGYPDFTRARLTLEALRQRCGP